MKTHKFRVWDKTTHQYLDSEYFRITGQGTVDNYISAEESDPNCVIEEFAGLLDKNNQEIYEGDIVKYGDNLGSIKFITGAYFIYNIDHRVTPLHYATINLINVIGNVNENSELLT